MFCLAAALSPVPSITCAHPTSGDQAKRLVKHWLELDSKPLKAAIGSKIIRVKTYNSNSGEPLYHVVFMEPQGFVVVGGDDTVEPIIAFVPEGKEYNASPDNPLGALLSQDLSSRIGHARQDERSAAGGGLTTGTRFYARAKRKWFRLESDAQPEADDPDFPTVSDLRVAPLLQTSWSQTTESGGNLCYNLFTPNNYPCGCVATAFAQIMKFFQSPDSPVGVRYFTVSVDGVSEAMNLLGGDGAGGAYGWLLMGNGPSISLAEQRMAIGRLTHDAGVSVNMEYASYGAAGNTLAIADSLKDTFGYSNAVKGFNFGGNIAAAALNNMANPNLDAGYPVILGVYGPSGGHAIVGDGYGYNSSTLYHHLNMGWSGSQNAWYNLPDIEESEEEPETGYNSVYKAVYNIYPSGTGEIISGRVVDVAGTPITGVRVTAARTGGGIYTAVTDSRGMYALAKIPSASTYQISASKSGYAFNSQSVATLTSLDISEVGNRWGVDFVEVPTGLSLGEATDNLSLQWTAGGDALWFGQGITAYFGEDAARSGEVANWGTSFMQTSVYGAGSLSFYWKVSSERDSDYLRFSIDDAEQPGAISGETDWTLRTFDLAGSGIHSLKWTYTKDGSQSSGSDCGWVDKVVFTAGGSDFPWPLFFPPILGGHGHITP
jgi:Peptidase C10 family/Carboxypeptidase regulatory-like domain/Spi protease inhibitor